MERCNSASEGEIHCPDDQRVRNYIVPLDRLSEDNKSESRKDHERDTFLHDLQLREREPLVAYPVGRDLEDIFEEGDSPTE
jgi:hypothetical protein